MYGWETEDEEDIWDIDLDFVSVDPDECDDHTHNHSHSHSHIPEFDMTIGQLMEYRYFQAEREEEQVTIVLLMDQVVNRMLIPLSISYRVIQHTREVISTLQLIIIRLHT